MTVDTENPLVRKLAAHTLLTPEARAALDRLPWTTGAFERGDAIVRKSDEPRAACLVLEGFACRFKSVGEDQRQILSIHMRGDLMDLHGLILSPLDHDIGALSPCRIGFIPAKAIADLIEHEPQATLALWRDTLLEAAIYREWIAGMGRRSAAGALAHLFCETMVRLEAAGLARGRRCAFPLTQADLADALGLSAVHLNRSLKALRTAGLIVFTGGVLTIVDWDKLRILGDFDPYYLHLRPA